MHCSRYGWGRGLGEGDSTVSGNLAILAFDQVEQRGPFREIFEVEAEFVVLRQSVEVGEVGFEEVGWVEWSEGCHDGIECLTSCGTEVFNVPTSYPSTYR